MSLLFSATLLISALLIFWLILRKIRRSEVTIADSTFWFLFALSLVLMGVFRQIPFSLRAFSASKALLTLYLLMLLPY